MKINPDWIAYFSAFLTPTIALLGLSIAYWQWKLARNKLKFDLFDRRLSIYFAANTFLASIMTSGKAKEEEIVKFMVATRQAKWLLNRSIATYFEKKLYYKALELQVLQSEVQDLPVGEDRSKNIHSQTDIKRWFMDQYDVLDEQFSPFLQLQH